jgi:mannose-6-phosphate isomerase-like protein (cupin superfamily)
MTAKLMQDGGLHVMAPGFQVIAKLPKKTVPIGPKFWIFQITNTDEYERGETPIVDSQEARIVEFGEDADGMPETLHGYDRAWIVLVGDPDRNFDVGDSYSATAGILVVVDATDAHKRELGFRCRYHCRVKVTRTALFRKSQNVEQWLNNLKDPVLAGIHLQEKSWIIV